MTAVSYVLGALVELNVVISLILCAMYATGRRYEFVTACTTLEVPTQP